MANKYYAVKVGRIPGIYQTWEKKRTNKWIFWCSL